MISLRKLNTTPASATEGLTVTLPQLGSHHWLSQGKTVDFNVQQVTRAMTPGLVYLHGEFLDATGGFGSVLINAGRALATV